jgi:hypothetical protein
MKDYAVGQKLYKISANFDQSSTDSYSLEVWIYEGKKSSASCNVRRVKIGRHDILTERQHSQKIPLAELKDFYESPEELVRVLTKKADRKIESEELHKAELQKLLPSEDA